MVSVMLSKNSIVKRTALWVRTTLLGLFFLIISFYLLLATGFLGETLGKVTGMIVSDEVTQISFRGLRTDIFWNTIADSVIVIDNHGLKIAICGTEIQGSLLDFLKSRHLDYIMVERLEINLPPETGEADSVPDSLSSILASIDKGIVISTDGFILEYGIITDPFGVILDSMYLDAVIKRESGVSVDVNSARVELPGFGQIRGNGTLTLVDGDVFTEGFTGIASPGSLLIAGTLSGIEETLNVDISGRLTTENLDIPVELSVSADGSISGRLSDLQANLTFSNGEAFLFGREAGFTVDTLTADLQSLAVNGLHLAADNASFDLDGNYNIASSEWDASFYLSMSNTDISEYLTALPDTRMTGSISASCSGNEYLSLNGSAIIDLSASSIDILDVSTLYIDATLLENNVDFHGSVSAGSESVTFSGRSFLGPDWKPVSWSAEVKASLGSLLFLEKYGISGLPAISGANMDINGSGTRFGMDLDGEIVVCEFSMSDISADTAFLQGTANLSRGNLTAGVSLVADSLRLLSDVFHVTADVFVDGDDITVDGLTLAASNSRIYTGEIAVNTGDTTRFAVENLRATHSKLRVITDGGLSGFAENGTIVLDSLWVDPPIGEFRMSGMMNEEKMSFEAVIDNFDFTTFSTFSGLPADMSGVGNFLISYSRDANYLQGSLTGKISDPEYGQFSMDSITIEISADEGNISVNGIYAWHEGVRSGLQLSASNVWSGTDFDLLAEKIDWLELEVNNIGDWFFYLLPLPINTVGASVSARAEYSREDDGDPSLEFQASARIRRLYITLLGVELPNVNFYLNYPDSTEQGYNTRLTLGAGSQSSGNFSSTLLADIRSIYPFELADYSIYAQLSEMEIPLPGIGAIVASGGVTMDKDESINRPVLTGKFTIIEGAIGIPQPVSASSSGGSGDLPFDLEIDISSTGKLWFRTSFANIEMAVKMRIFSLERKPTVNGYIDAVRGRITILQRDFEIVEGRVQLIQGIPPTVHLNVTAETTVRSIMNRDEYHITILITGDMDNSVITLTGEGPGGQIAQEDILTLLAAGLTYGEMQQLNSAALRSEAETLAQTMLGSLIARNIRDDIGLDTFEISPELMSDTTSLVLNVGKYVLPDLYVSYEGDVFSANPGTFSAQYLFSSELYVEGSTKSTIHGDMEPTLEIHYTIRY
ncbi:MAG: translocation/assembly module TamB domain-containing protein [Candidatus Aegiribacteria sp.]|nr:translocation/assembly module TamB domain-containing protein [Candidatus Aegiribacteria sp.]